MTHSTHCPGCGHRITVAGPSHYPVCLAPVELAPMGPGLWTRIREWAKREWKALNDEVVAGSR